MARRGRLDRGLNSALAKDDDVLMSPAAAAFLFEMPKSGG